MKPVTETTIPKSRPPLKFGKETRQFSVRLPIDTIEKIKGERIDTGQILFDVIERGMDPYGKPMPVHDVGPVLTKKLIELMMENSITAPEGYFTDTETKVIMGIIEGAIE